MDDRELITQQTYNKIAKKWDENHSVQGFWQKGFDVFEKLLPQGKVLDVGCGAGRDYQFFQQGSYEYVGVDYSRELLNIASKHFPGAIFVEGNINELPFENDEFDGFWAAASLLHIPKENIDPALQEIRRVVRENGVGFIALKKGEGEQIVLDDEDEEDRRFLPIGRAMSLKRCWKAISFPYLIFSRTRQARKQHGLCFS